MRIDIPLPTPEEPECTTPPLGGVHATLVATTPKTPWKPRITLMAEVNDLLNRGMADDYNCESEHSTMGKEAAMEADMPPPQKAEVPAPPLDTSSQASVEQVVHPWRVAPSMFIPLQPHVAAVVTVQCHRASGRCQPSHQLHALS